MLVLFCKLLILPNKNISKTIKEKKSLIYKCFYWICITNWNEMFSFGVSFLLCLCSQTLMIPTRISTQCIIIWIFFWSTSWRDEGKEENCNFLKTKYCIVRKLLYSLSVQLGKKSQIFFVKTEGVFQLFYYSSELLPRKLNRRLTKYLAKKKSFII